MRQILGKSFLAAAAEVAAAGETPMAEVEATYKGRDGSTVVRYEILGWTGVRDLYGRPVGGAVVRLRRADHPDFEVTVGLGPDGRSHLIAILATGDEPLTVRRVLKRQLGTAEDAARDYLAGVLGFYASEEQTRQARAVEAEYRAYLQDARARLPEGDPRLAALEAVAARQVAMSDASGLRQFAMGAVEPEPVRSSRSGRPPLSDHELAKVAEVFTRLSGDGKGNAYERTAKEFGKERSTIVGRITRATKAGILTKTVQGRGGRTLTAKGRALLEEEQ